MQARHCLLHYQKSLISKSSKSSFESLNIHRYFFFLISHMSLFNIFCVFFIVVQVQLSPFSLHHAPRPHPQPLTHPLWLFPCVLHTCSFLIIYFDLCPFRVYGEICVLDKSPRKTLQEHCL